MKSKYLIILAVVLIVVPGFAFASGAASRYYILNEGETVEGDLLKAAESLEVAGRINGDAMLAGGSVSVPGDISGDVLAAGGNVTFSGNSGQDVRLAGGNIYVSGTVAKNITAAGGNVQLEEGTQISGRSYLAGGKVTLRGVYKGQVKLFSGMATVTGDIEGDLVFRGGELTLTSAANIAGKLVYYSPQEAKIDGNAVISGGIEYHQTEYGRAGGVGKKSAAAAGFWLYLAWALVSGLIVLYAGWRMFKGRIPASAIDPKVSFWARLGWGLIAAIVTPVAAILLMITVIGIPLGLIAAGLYLVAAYLAYIFGALLLGGFLAGLLGLRTDPSKFPWLAFIIGVAVLSFIGLIPFLGFLAALIVWLWGLGVLARLLFSKPEATLFPPAS